MDSSGHKSATSSTQRPYRTSKSARRSRAYCTVIFMDRLSHSVDRPRAFLHVLSSCTQIRQYRIPDGSEFMKFSVRIPILNLHKHSAQVRFTSGELRIMGNSGAESELGQTYAPDEYYIPYKIPIQLHFRANCDSGCT